MKPGPSDIPKVSRGDFWVNRIYFVLLPIILGITLIGLFVTLQTNSQNKDLNKQSLNCTRAVGEAIAKYTQDLVPIKLDPKTCTITADQPKPTNNTSTGETTPASTPQVSTPAPKPDTPTQNTPQSNPAPSQPNNPAPPSTPPPDRGVLPDGIPVLGPLL